jgi:hypothetical protein
MDERGPERKGATDTGAVQEGAKEASATLLQGRLEWCEGLVHNCSLGVILLLGSHIYPGSSDV